MDEWTRGQKVEVLFWKGAYDHDTLPGTILRVNKEHIIVRTDDGETHRVVRDQLLHLRDQ